MTAVLERSTTIPEPSRHHPPGPDFPTIAPPTQCCTSPAFSWSSSPPSPSSPLGGRQGVHASPRRCTRGVIGVRSSGRFELAVVLRTFTRLHLDLECAPYDRSSTSLRPTQRPWPHATVSILGCSRATLLTYGAGSGRAVALPGVRTAAQAEEQAGALAHGPPTTAQVAEIDAFSVRMTMSVRRRGCARIRVRRGFGARVTGVRISSGQPIDGIWMLE